jgi:putative membrane protein
MWIWENPGTYFSIPWSNYLGWLLISALITAIIRPERLPVAPLLIIYTAFWLLNSVGLGFFWGIPGAAAAGCLGMGAVTIFAWRAFLSRD